MNNFESHLLQCLLLSLTPSLLAPSSKVFDIVGFKNQCSHVTKVKFVSNPHPVTHSSHFFVPSATTTTVIMSSACHTLLSRPDSDQIQLGTSQSVPSQPAALSTSAAGHSVRVSYQKAICLNNHYLFYGSINSILADAGTKLGVSFTTLWNCGIAWPRRAAAGRPVSDTSFPAVTFHMRWEPKMKKCCRQSPSNE